MEKYQLKGALLGYWNDHLEILPYGHGFMIYMPWTYSDEDATALFVEQHGFSYRITDHGATYARVASGGINMDTQRVREAWRQALGPLGTYAFNADEDEIAAITTEQDLPLRLTQVASACIRAEQVAMLGGAPKRVQFAEQVSRTAASVASTVNRAKVKAQAPVPLRSGRTRTITALVSSPDHADIWIQAVGGNNKQAREDQLERCYHVFGLGQSENASRIAAVHGSRELWGDAMAREIEGVSTEVVYMSEDPRILEAKLRLELASSTSA